LSRVQCCVAVLCCGEETQKSKRWGALMALAWVVGQARTT
jgi:hypothetical protein